MKLILFDLDGTLGGYGVGNGLFLQKAWGELRLEFPALDFGDDKSFLNACRHLETKCWGAWAKKELRIDRSEVPVHIWAQLLQSYGVEDKTAQERGAQLHAAMEAAYPSVWTPAPGALDVLRWAKEQGAVLAVLSNGIVEEQTGKLRDHGMLDFFDHLFFSSEVGFGKPDPRIFELALREAGCEPGEALMIGDSYSHDIAPAEQLGMQRIWIYNDGAVVGLPDERSVSKVADVPHVFLTQLL